MLEKIQFHQALFGYKDGHNLIASSVKIDPRATQFLAKITDGSGAEKVEGFEVSYTGIPVPDSGYYALFCTWPAPEMSRPGCVWSHVILIEFSDIARIPDLHTLIALFVRPQGPQFSVYSEQIELEFASDLVSALNKDIEAYTAAYVINQLYSKPDKGIVVLYHEGKLWEKIIFSIWSQQWPKLRRQFSFSTGSLGDRRASDVNFDIQVAPMTSLRIWQRTPYPTVVMQYSGTPSLDAMALLPEWARSLLDDLSSSQNRPLRKFLFKYGSEVDAPRASFVALVNCYESLRIDFNGNPTTALVQIAEAFPDPADVLSLKRDALGMNRTTVLMQDAFRTDQSISRSWAVVYFLLQAEVASAYSGVDFDFSSYVRFFWNNKRADLYALLGRLPDSSNASKFLAALDLVLEARDVPVIWREQPNALPRIILSRPSLASGVEAWGMSHAGQRMLWSCVYDATADANIWASICVAMLGAQCPIKESQTVELSGMFLAEYLLVWVRSSSFNLPSHSWREALRPTLREVLHKGSIPAPLLALAIWSLPSKQSRLFPGDRGDVQMLADKDFESVPAALTMYTHFWLTAIGLQTDKKDGVVLLSRSFFYVYDAVARSEYSSEAWDLLAPTLPELLFGFDWDRCMRLRLALRLWMDHNPEYVNALGSSVKNMEHMHLIQSLR